MNPHRHKTKKEERERRTFQKKMGDSQNESAKASGGAGGSNKTLIILGIVVGVVFIAMAGVIIYLLVGRNKTEETPTAPVAEAPAPEKREVLVTESNVKEVVEQMEQVEYTPPGYYTVTQNYTWHFPSGTEASTDAHVENDPGNTNDVYFDLFMADDDYLENPIYQSPVIPIGAALEKFKLDTALEAGTYDCVVVYHLVDSEQRSMSTVSMAVQVIVEG